MGPSINLPPDRIYYEELRFVDQGMALWQADPFDEYPVVKVGDVGFVDKGKFYPRWNFWTDKKKETKEPSVLTRKIDATEPFRSRSITTNAVKAGVESEQAVASAEAGVGYVCTSARGALLALKDGYAISRDLDKAPASELEAYMLSDYEVLLAASTCKKLDEVIIVTGCTLTGDWDAAVWSAGQQGHHAGVAGGVPQMVLAKTSITVHKSVDQGLLKSSGHSHQALHRHSGSSQNLHEEGSAACIEAKCETAPKNQCIFIRASRIRKRFLHSGVKVMKAMAEEKDPDQGENKDDQATQAVLAASSSTGSETEGETPAETPETPGDTSVMLESFPEKLGGDNPTIYDELFDYLFNYSDAELALVHDRDVPKWLNYKNDPSQQLPLIVNPVYKAVYLRPIQAKALIASVRYRGQKRREKNIEIQKDHFEAHRLRDLLISKYGYNESDIVMLLEGETEREPTKANLVEEMNRLVSFASAGDRFVFYFSGHSSQEFISKEEDGNDGSIEAIWPMDSASGDQLLLERELHDHLVNPIQEIKCRLNTMIDVSHGETILDLSGTIPFTQRNVRDVRTYNVNIRDDGWENPADFGVDVHPQSDDQGDSFAHIQEESDAHLAQELQESEEQQAASSPLQESHPEEEPATATQGNETENVEETPGTPIAEHHPQDAASEGAHTPVAGSPVTPTAPAPPAGDETDPQPDEEAGEDGEEPADNDDAVVPRTISPELKYPLGQAADDVPFPVYPPSRPNKFQVVRGKLGMSENYIVTSSSNWNSPEEGEASTSSTGAMLNQIEPTIVRFSRRAVLRLRPVEDFGPIIAPTTAFPSDINMHQDQVLELIQETSTVIAQLNSLADGAAPACKMILECTAEDLVKAMETNANIIGPSLLMHAGIVFLAKFLCSRLWLLQDSQTEPLKSKRQMLLLLILDLEAFYSKCHRVARDFGKGVINQEKKTTEDAKNEKRCRDFEQHLQQNYNDLLQIQPSDLREDPGNNPLLRDENSYLPVLPTVAKATVTSWTVCRPVESYWQETKHVGIDTSLIDMLSETPHATYRMLLQGATQQLETTSTGTSDVLTDRAQLSTLSLLDLDSEFTF